MLCRQQNNVEQGTILVSNVENTLKKLFIIVKIVRVLQRKIDRLVERFYFIFYDKSYCRNVLLMINILL